jgi:carbamoyl-phosphate synthase large subunit
MNTKHANILFLGAGRRVSLAERFIARGHKIYSYEISSQVPISSVATVIEGLFWEDDRILNHIADVCIKNEIELVIPFQDEALLVCSRLQEKGFSCVCSKYGASKICFDKRRFELFVLQNFEDMYPKEGDSFPKIAKPIFGNDSRGVYTINSTSDKVNRNECIVQTKISGIEYSVDAFFDNQGFFIDAVSRRRIRVDGGEVVTSLIERCDRIIQNTKIVGEKLQLRGPACFQYMMSDKPYLIEINARFGGGVTLSLEAGFDMIGLVEKYYLGRKISYSPGSWRNKLLMQRCYRDFFYEW